MSEQFTREQYEELNEALEQRDSPFLRQQLAELHPADVAEFIEDQPLEEATYLFSLLPVEEAGDVLAELDEDKRRRILSALTPEEIVGRFIGEMESDDAADVINELPTEVRQQVVEHLSRDPEVLEDVVYLLNFEEDSAGGLMARELVKVNINCSLSECIDEIRKQAAALETIYAVYVVDDEGKLKGLVPLQQLIVSRPGKKIRDIYKEDVVYVTVTDSAEEVANIMDKYGLVALPVVDETGLLLGRITIDDVVDFIREEAEEDMQLMSGISEDVEYSDKIWKISRARLPWLLLGLLGGIASSKVIEQYEPALSVYPEMAIFIPLIAAMGGNAGIQSSAIVLQSLASKTFGSGNVLEKIVKELGVALLNGLLVSAILLGYGLVLNDSLALSVTVSTALMTVIVVASLLGLLIPLMLNRFKIDPALATGPFITTANDLIGLAIYFLVGRLMYGML